MPEGPELARSRDHLRKLVQGKRLRTFGINRNHGGSTGGRYADKDPEGMLEFLGSLKATEAVIDSVNVKGKFMWWTLALKDGTAWWLWCTYGMSGQWTTNKPDKHTAATAWVDNPDGSGLLAVNFRDPRHFGTLKFVNNQKQMERKLASLGPDMLNDPPDTTKFRQALLRKHDRTLAEVLMDQSVVSGVGNYVKAESLYLAELSPHRLVRDLKTAEFEHLRQQIINVMRASYNNGGATIRSYVNVDGTKGGMTSRFAVYGNKTDPMGNPVVKEETADGRTTHWVPTIQK
jgi:formamidopyrimidine-DNA glycosylase